MHNDRKTLQLTTIISMHITPHQTMNTVQREREREKTSPKLMQIYFILEIKCSCIYYLFHFSHIYHDDNFFTFVHFSVLHLFRSLYISPFFFLFFLLFRTCFRSFVLSFETIANPILNTEAIHYIECSS